jgi:hypothetical protein
MPSVLRPVAVAAIVLASVALIAPAGAQGVGPGGPIGNSTGIGSGTGVMGTGPAYQNGTGQPVLAPPPPPGGAPVQGGSVSTSPPSGLSSGPSSYPQPGEPFASSAPRQPSTVPLALPDGQAGGVAFMKGCWRSEAFPYGQHSGTTTWCFDDKGKGHFLYARIDQPTFFCRAEARARFERPELHLVGTKTSCTDGSAVAPTSLDCRAEGTDTRCSAEGVPPVHLNRVR